MKATKWLIPIVFFLLLLAYGAMQFRGVGKAAQEKAGENAKAVGKSQSGPLPTPGEGKKGKMAPVVTVETVESSALSKTMEATGSVTATRVARMASPGEGPVQDCKIREGDRIKSGQRVVTIGRNKAAQAQLSAALQSLKEQELELQRVDQLVKGGAIPGAQLDAARSKHEAARAQVSKARESAEDYSVTAPWDGLVAKVHVADGDYVAPRTVLVEIFDPHSLVVQFAVPEAQSTEVRNGMSVLVQLDAYPGRTFNGTINRVYPQLDVRMRTRTVEAILADPIDLIPGMFARIQVLLANIPDAVTVPTEAVLVTPKGDKAAYVLKDGKALRRKVQTGVEEGGRVQILSGIKPGEQVIVAGNEKLKDGASVQVRGGPQS